MAHHQEVDLVMKFKCTYPALHLKFSTEGLLDVISGIYVDASLHYGNDKFLVLTDASLKKFEPRNREMDKWKFYGVNVLYIRYGIDIH